MLRRNLWHLNWSRKIPFWHYQFHHCTISYFLDKSLQITWLANLNLILLIKTKCPSDISPPYLLSNMNISPGLRTTNSSPSSSQLVHLTSPFQAAKKGNLYFWMFLTFSVFILILQRHHSNLSKIRYRHCVAFKVAWKITQQLFRLQESDKAQRSQLP